jgi:Phosphate-starvation-inducible E family
VFHRTEQIIYVALGPLLSATALVGLAGVGRLLWGGVQDWTGTDVVFRIIDRLLFVLMLIKTLYTVQASMRSGVLSSKPFLIVALIACVRQALIILLETSRVTPASA